MLWNKILSVSRGLTQESQDWEWNERLNFSLLTIPGTELLSTSLAHKLHLLTKHKILFHYELEYYHELSI